jgi:hypothetical protein
MLLVLLGTGYDKCIVDRISTMLATNVKVVYTQPTNLSFTLLEHIAYAGLAVNTHAIMDMDYCGNLKKTTVLLITRPAELCGLTVDMVTALQHDQVIFDTVSVDTDQHWMLATTHAMIKVCISANKLTDLLPAISDRFSPYCKSTGNLFPLVWYAQRIGLKVYDSAR